MFPNEHRFKEKDEEDLGRYLKRCGIGFLPCQESQFIHMCDHSYFLSEDDVFQ